MSRLGIYSAEIARTQLERAGIRLAMLLNIVLSKQQLAGMASLHRPGWAKGAG
jgi:hypothetical protein